MVHGNNEMRNQKTRVPALVLPVIFTSCVVWGIHVTTQNLPFLLCRRWITFVPSNPTGRQENNRANKKKKMKLGIFLIGETDIQYYKNILNSEVSNPLSYAMCLVRGTLLKRSGMSAVSVSSQWDKFKLILRAVSQH